MKQVKNYAWLLLLFAFSTLTAQPPSLKDLIPLNEVASPRLGQDRDTKYEQVKMTLDLGDRILFYTDGIQGSL